MTDSPQILSYLITTFTQHKFFSFFVSNKFFRVCMWSYFLFDFCPFYGKFTGFFPAKGQKSPKYLHPKKGRVGTWPTLHNPYLIMTFTKKSGDDALKVVCN